MIEVGIVGGTGYTGVELLRLLARHPEARLRVITSRGNAGTRVDELFPSLRGEVELAFSEPDVDRLAACDLVFFATPNGTAMQMVPDLLARDTRVVDLGADFRLKDVETWSRWYGMTHACPELVAEAAYGLPELNREAIRGARLVANPGCYPTAVGLGWLPLLEAGLVETRGLVASCVSGASGAGRAANVATLLCEVNESFKAYGADGHRHLPEIRQSLAQVAGGAVELTFVPHLVPMTRGMHASLYATLRGDAGDLQVLFEQRYADEPFVDVLPAGAHPETRTVRGTNLCRLAVRRAPESDQVIVLSVIDNLTKGAAGQAVQNMNLMFGLPETAGLDAPAVLP
ncbi:N-acetyl-gamma-glutamyl-phosphate reductase [Alkalilimnicola ehrlichii MLHE-1]|uniref:N-acetyl-gamma-glutamyl-phosphate reductase n=1 Tax=Alkalilimnicola ehrlichii (strain ATCC BAA-1101 / DSM 17681 / MLHE-1) TaxID=187272 RepID=ARGC_ALKEH|nr:N-acetyl-gamma-glutamyl-phosphate reductase [Alkalilimnicola ehrlichii]Q0ABJ9.1 RecName: Full=N-acetyl-gamma-glutamyl-phosphate reductase; Short=AGPR; AltName: Full=N-acetyl-glutamate semialdehyde dehydrogenase; Short=NAGSA dehydrogenase [Alkalilimnicola ehrlichii MLHE-1]ABI55788.1 N-acetyl-gamma-glutamyl-phosphate reductase [Alkalilimnicola ehrlichii MLHE-1]